MEDQKEREAMKTRVGELEAQVLHLTQEVQELTARLSDTSRLLSETQSKYHELFDDSPEIIYSHDLAGNFTSFNPAAQHFLGYEPETLIKMNIKDVVHPDYIGLAEKNLRLKVQGGQEVTGPYELLVRSANGAMVWVELYSRLIRRDGKPIAIQGFVRNVATRKLAEKKLRSSEERYRHFLDNFQGIAFSAFPFQKPVLLLGEVEQITGYTKSAIMSGAPHWTQVIHPDDLASFQDVVNKLGNSRNFSVEKDFRIIRKDGKIRWLSMFAQSMNNGSGDRTFIQGAIYDVSNRKSVEELTLKNERWKAFEEIAGGIAHNFNNILQIILSGTQLVLSDIQSGTVSGDTEILELILKNCKIGAQTVKKMEIFAGISGTGNSPRYRVIDLSEVAGDAVQFAESWWRRKPENEGLSVDLGTDFGIDCHVWGISHDLFSVILDLIKNAFEALRGGGQIEVITRSEQDKIVLEVQDTGVGLELEYQDKIFTPFFSTKLSVGSGLGLATSLRIIENHGGDIQYIPSEDPGSIFRIELPRASVGTEGLDSMKEGQKADKLRILLIDDNEHVLRALKERFSAFGHNVVPAISGIQALDYFRDQRFDLVVCDLGLPRMNGLEVAGNIKTFCAEKEIPKPVFVILTGWDIDNIDHNKIVESGVDEIMQKPADLSKLFSLIKSVDRKMIV